MELSMTAKIIDGKQIAQDMREEIKTEAAQLKEKGVVPGLGVILVGENPASVSYVTAKQRTSKELGFYSVQDTQPEDITEEALLALVEKHNKDPKIHGILVQLPLPKHINENKVLYAVDPDKDDLGRGLFRPAQDATQETHVIRTPRLSMMAGILTSRESPVKKLLEKDA